MINMLNTYCLSLTICYKIIILNNTHNVWYTFRRIITNTSFTGIISPINWQLLINFAIVSVQKRISEYQLLCNIWLHNRLIIGCLLQPSLILLTKLFRKIKAKLFELLTLCLSSEYHPVSAEILPNCSNNSKTHFSKLCFFFKKLPVLTFWMTWKT